jgi:hypothetical protein
MQRSVALRMQQQMRANSSGRARESKQLRGDHSFHIPVDRLSVSFGL